MSNQRRLNNLLLSIIATVTVFLLTVSYAPSARAAVTEAYQSNGQSPVVLAYYYGPRFYRHAGWGYRNWYGYRCERTCYINRWGYRSCHCR